MLNKVLLTGRLTAAPELKTTASGINVTTFSLAVQRNYKNGAGEYDTDFINCVAWRNQADFITRFFDKGQLITVVGALTSRRYEDANGNKRTAFEVVVDEALFAESKREAGARPAPEFSAPATTGGNDIAFDEFSDDELPF
jgi:single-strand DNA-binding protein